MDVKISEEPLSALEEYGGVGIAFEVRSVLDVEVREGGLGGFLLSERTLEVPYVKDYDAIEGEGPTKLAQHFDLSRWGVLLARADGRCVGGALVAFQTAAVTMLEGRNDLAAVWDIRVAPEARRHGVGSALFRAAEAWAIARGCRWLKVETQNNNVAACRFYARQGCVLGVIDRFAYPELPGEVQLLWYKRLS
jgi:ribosomal protein S18 acetylase RimI-like enzyme